MTSGEYNKGKSYLEKKAGEIMHKENSDLGPLFKSLERIANTLDDLSDNLISALSRSVPSGSNASDANSDLPEASCQKDESTGEFVWVVPEAALAKPRPCSRCDFGPIHWVISRKGKKVPLEADGHSHISRCGKDRSEFEPKVGDNVPF